MTSSSAQPAARSAEKVCSSTQLIPGDLLARAEKACAGAIVAWGSEPQYRQVQEECAELIAAINQMARGRDGSREAVIEETADVILCLLQMRLMLGVAVEDRLSLKLERLEARVQASQALGNSKKKRSGL